MNAGGILTIFAVVLVLASVATKLRGTASWAARRTWLLIAAIFLVMSLWLSYAHGDSERSTVASSGESSLP